jgi:hypothetical protein
VFCSTFSYDIKGVCKVRNKVGSIRLLLDRVWSAIGNYSSKQTIWLGFFAFSLCCAQSDPAICSLFRAKLWSQKMLKGPSIRWRRGRSNVPGLSVLNKGIDYLIYFSDAKMYIKRWESGMNSHTEWLLQKHCNTTASCTRLRWEKLVQVDSRYWTWKKGGEFLITRYEVWIWLISSSYDFTLLHKFTTHPFQWSRGQCRA